MAACGRGGGRNAHALGCGSRTASHLARTRQQAVRAAARSPQSASPPPRLRLCRRRRRRRRRRTLLGVALPSEARGGRRAGGSAWSRGFAPRPLDDSPRQARSRARTTVSCRRPCVRGSSRRRPRTAARPAAAAAPPGASASWARAALRDERSKMMPFRYADLGEMLSLGDSAGKKVRVRVRANPNPNPNPNPNANPNPHHICVVASAHVLVIST